MAMQDSFETVSNHARSGKKLCAVYTKFVDDFAKLSKEYQAKLVRLCKVADEDFGYVLPLPRCSLLWRGIVHMLWFAFRRVRCAAGVFGRLHFASVHMPMTSFVCSGHCCLCMFMSVDVL